MNVTLIDPPETDAEGNTRSFSISSAPFEADLAVATRMRDARAIITGPQGIIYAVVNVSVRVG